MQFWHMWHSTVDDVCIQECVTVWLCELMSNCCSVLRNTPVLCFEGTGQTDGVVYVVRMCECVYERLVSAAVSVTLSSLSFLCRISTFTAIC